MSATKKLGMVSVGYLLALVAGMVAARVYDLQMAALPYDTSGGVYAGGQLMAATTVFLLVAMIPTLMALWFLRANLRFWHAVAIAAVVLATAGLLAILAPLVRQGSPRTVGTLLIELVSLVQLFGAPLWAGAFATLAWLAPTHLARRLFNAAFGIELMAAMCAVIHWFVPASPL